MTSLNEYAERINKCAVDHGFWEEDRNFGEMIALMHSELSEALESHRSAEEPVWFKHAEGCALNSPLRDKGWICTCTPKPEGTATELADCIIRCLDTLHSLGVDIDEVVSNKIAYNESRPYKHGRKY